MAEPDPMIQALDAAHRSGDIDPPKGWETYQQVRGQLGSAIITLPRPGASEHDLLLGAGFDPSEWRITGEITTRRWQSRSKYDTVPAWLTSYKFDVTQGEAPEDVELHIEDLVKHLRRRRPAPKRVETGNDAWLYVAADWQIGKREGADGTPQTVDRVLESIDMAKQQVKDLRRIGRRMPQGGLLGTGDIVEGCHGNYPNQQFLVDATRREQNKISRELITRAIDELAPLFDSFLVATVAGNHGEHRNDGRKVTDDSDNDDVACFEAVREAFSRAGDPGIEWIIPHDELSIAFELGGVPLTAAHGHTFGGGPTAQKKALEWWKSQDFGFQAARDAWILISSHYHHFSAVTYGRRTHLQTPAMDPGSKWYRDLKGEDTPAGALTLRLDAEEPLGYADLQILSPRRRAA